MIAVGSGAVCLSLLADDSGVVCPNLLANDYEAVRRGRPLARGSLSHSVRPSHVTSRARDATVPPVSLRGVEYMYAVSVVRVWWRPPTRGERADVAHLAAFRHPLRRMKRR